jgi:hypothetical protein
MTSFPTPANYSDQYNDYTRPDGLIASMDIGHGEYRRFVFSSATKLWSSTIQPQIVVQMASPTSSPAFPGMAQTQTSLLPTTFSGIAPAAPNSSAQRVVFPPLKTVSTVPAAYTARMLLDVVPAPINLTNRGVVYDSSAANQYYGTVGPLSYWNLPRNLGGYNDLPEYAQYPPIAHDPLSGGTTEGDTIYATMNAIFLPVNMVLSNNSRGFPLRSFCEASHSTKVTIQLPIGGAIFGEHLSRVDRTWAFFHQGKWIKFAIVEFTRPGALDAMDWDPAIQGGEVQGTGAKMCRQGLKYCYAYNVSYIAFSDGSKVIFLKIGGARQDWFNSIPLAAGATPAQARWVDSLEEMKRNAYVFFQEALEYKLGEYGLISSQLY